MKLYCTTQVSATTPECQFVLDKLYKCKTDMHDNLDVEHYGYACLLLHRYIREKLDLPNKVFSFAKRKDTRETILCLFNIEPEYGVLYDTYIDEEGMYIIVPDK